MRTRLLFLVVAPILATSSTLPGQVDRDSSVSPRQATVTAGLGNAMGWLGAQVEWYFENDQISAFAGLGYTPAVDDGDPSGITGAAGLRIFTTGIRHRGFLEFSVSQVAIQSGYSVDDKRLYGPGVQLGYQYAALSGFTFMVSAGAGVALGVDDAVDESAVQVLLGLGFGYTWR